MSGRKRIMAGLGTLRGQLALIGLLLVGTAVLALVMLSLRPVFEGFIRETWRPLPATLSAAAETLATGRADAPALAGLTAEQSELLYEHWMASDPTAEAGLQVTALLALPGDAVRGRARITTLCGDPRQRLRAVLLLGQAADARAQAIVAAAIAAAERRREHDLAAEMRRAAGR